MTCDFWFLEEKLFQRISYFPVAFVTLSIQLMTLFSVIKFVLEFMGTAVLLCERFFKENSWTSNCVVLTSTRYATVREWLRFRLPRIFWYKIMISILLIMQKDNRAQATRQFQLQLGRELETFSHIYPRLCFPLERGQCIFFCIPKSIHVIHYFQLSDHITLSTRDWLVIWVIIGPRAHP